MYTEMNYYNACPCVMPDKRLLDLIKDAMQDEKHDYKKYKMMMDMTDNKEINAQINHAYEDEGKHYKMFQKLYEELTGRKVEIPPPEVERYSRLVDAVKSSVDGELEAVEMYRQIRSMLNGKRHRDMLYEIITDEQEHATRFTYLYAMLK